MGWQHQTVCNLAEIVEEEEEDSGSTIDTDGLGEISEEEGETSMDSNFLQIAEEETLKAAHQVTPSTLEVFCNISQSTSDVPEGEDEILTDSLQAQLGGAFLARFIEAWSKDIMCSRCAGKVALAST